MKDFPTAQKQIIGYIKKNLAKGYTLDTLKYSLLAQGYGRTSVEKALEQAKKESNGGYEEKPKITHTVIQESSQVQLENQPNTLQKLWRRFLD